MMYQFAPTLGTDDAAGRHGAIRAAFNRALGGYIRAWTSKLNEEGLRNYPFMDGITREQVRQNLINLCGNTALK